MDKKSRLEMELIRGERYRQSFAGDKVSYAEWTERHFKQKPQELKSFMWKSGKKRKCYTIYWREDRKDEQIIHRCKTRQEAEEKLKIEYNNIREHRRKERKYAYWEVGIGAEFEDRTLLK